MYFEKFTAGEDDSGRRLDKIIRKFIKEKNLSTLYSCIRKGLIKVNGKKSCVDEKINYGDTIQIASFLLEEQNKNIYEKLELMNNEKNYKFPYEILFKNNDILIINKPYGKNVHGGADSLERDIKLFYKLTNNQHSLSFLPGPLHRLDKNTSGALVFSWSILGAHWFSENIYKIEKTYSALIQGTMKVPEVWQDNILVTEKTKNKHGFYTVDITNNIYEGKKAVTYAEPCCSFIFNNIECTLVKFNIKTGRTHQIRIQSAKHGFPLLGDTAYGGIKIDGKQKLFLHAEELKIPQENPLMLPKKITAPMPELFASVLKKYNSEYL